MCFVGDSAYGEVQNDDSSGDPFRPSDTPEVVALAVDAQ